MFAHVIWALYIQKRVICKSRAQLRLSHKPDGEAGRALAFLQAHSPGLGIAWLLESPVSRLIRYLYSRRVTMGVVSNAVGSPQASGVLVLVVCDYRLKLNVYFDMRHCLIAEIVWILCLQSEQEFASYLNTLLAKWTRVNWSVLLTETFEARILNFKYLHIEQTLYNIRLLLKD